VAAVGVLMETTGKGFTDTVETAALVDKQPSALSPITE
jgi:hypothetical protein